MGLIGSILRKATRKSNETLNIIAFPTHERYFSNLARTNHNFYLLQLDHINTWNEHYAPIPENVILLPKGTWLPIDKSYDLILSQNKFGQMQYSLKIARQLHLPIVNIEHTAPLPNWSNKHIEGLKALKGDLNLFISEWSRKQWGWTAKEADVIHHGIDTDIFCPAQYDRKPYILSVVNDWIQRDWCLLAGHKILTDVGYINIENIKVGNNVLTDDGTYHIVTQTFKRDYFGDIINIHLDSYNVVRITPTHSIRVFRDNQWSYIEASRVKIGDILRFPNHTQTDFSFENTEQAWLIGLIIGDGSISNQGCISITCNSNKTNIINKAKRIIDNWINTSNISERPRKRGCNAISIETHAKIFAIWLQTHIGGKSCEKKIPNFIMNGSSAVRLATLQGLWAADGSFKNGVKHSPRGCFSTISPRLASQVSSLLHSFGIKCTISRHKRTTNKSNGNIVPIYRVVITGRDNVESCKSIIQDNTSLIASNESYHYIVKDITIDREWSGYVYNCKVENNPSYVIYPGITAHNCCNFQGWQRITHGLPVKPIGNTPGLSRAAKDINELIKEYQQARIFINTATISPIPTALLEAMACGCACVSLATCMVPEIIQHDYNGMISNDEQELRSYCEELLNNKEKCIRLGQNARKTIIEKFSLNKFIDNWDKIFYKTANIIYKGI